MKPKILFFLIIVFSVCESIIAQSPSTQNVLAARSRPKPADQTRRLRLKRSRSIISIPPTNRTNADRS